MRIEKFSILVVCIFLIGCASNEIRVGTEAWYNKRMAEVEDSYKNKKIDEAKYLELKNQVDAIRADYLSGRQYTHTHFGYGSNGGGSIGIGVGF